MNKMLNIEAVSRIYYNLINSGECDDLQETDKAREILNAHLIKNDFNNDKEEARKRCLYTEKLIGNFAMENERQGFIYGFSNALNLLTSGKDPYYIDRLDYIIRCEYSTSIVEKIDKTDRIMEIFKKYVPKEKYTDVVDVLCVCIDETKYAVFEQGFIRGIAAEKGGN